MGKSVSDGKSAIASAITAKGVSTASDATFEKMVENILKIVVGAKVGNVYNSGPLTTSLTIPTNSGTTYIVVISSADTGHYNSLSIARASNANYTELSRQQYKEDRSVLVVYKLIKSNKSQESVIGIDVELDFIVAIAID